MTLIFQQSEKTSNLLIGIFAQWDSDWFTHIATEGYFTAGSGQNSIAFFPGYPGASGVLSDVLGGQPALAFALWFIPLVASLVFLAFLGKIAEIGFGSTVARRSLVLAAFGPYALFLVASYSASLFLAFAVLAWWTCLQHRYLLSGIFAALASVTRISGAFLLIALIVMYVCQRRAAGLPIFRAGLAKIGIGALGIGGYCVYIWIGSGSPFTWLTAQSLQWGREFHWPWTSFALQGNRMLSDPFDRLIQAWFEMGYAVLSLAIGIGLIRQRKWPEATFLVFSLLALMTSSGYESLARNMLTVFPLFIFVANFATNLRARWLYPATFATGVLFSASIHGNLSRDAGQDDRLASIFHPPAEGID